MMSMIMYSVISCMSFANGLEQDLQSVMPGNASYAITRNCDFRYDEFGWAGIEVQMRLHLQQRTCLNDKTLEGCQNEYNDNVFVTIEGELGDLCKPDLFDVTSNMKDFLINTIPDFETRFIKNIDTEIKHAIKTNGEYRSICSNVRKI
jgi:hypothetical protein